MAHQRRKQAVRVWLIATIIVFLWAMSIVAAPILRLADMPAIANPLYGFFSYICHQIPSRSLSLAGEQLAVCSRCFGVYLGLFLGLAAYPLVRRVDNIEPFPRIWLILSIVPIAIDWSLTIFGIWENTQASRFLTGLILGTACAVFIAPALVEITRNLTHRR